MTTNRPDFEALKARHRAQRETWPSAFDLRVHRGISWVGRAGEERKDYAARFLVLWIAFNSAHGGERSSFTAYETDICRMWRRDPLNRAAAPDTTVKRDEIIPSLIVQFTGFARTLCQPVLAERNPQSSLPPMVYL